MIFRKDASLQLKYQTDYRHIQKRTLYLIHAKIKRGKSRLRITTGTQNMFFLFSFSNTWYIKSTCDGPSFQVK